MYRLFILLSIVCWCDMAIGTGQPVDPFAQVKRMGRGVNIIGYDPLWQDAAMARFQDRHYRLIREAGFKTVRINLNCLHRMDTNLRLPEIWFTTLEHQVREALRNDLIVILDLHDFTTVAKDPVAFQPRVIAFWRQVAERFKDAPDTVIFELLNEPNGLLTADLWNAWIPEILTAIRTSNSARTVIVGSADFNGMTALTRLSLPDNDRNLIATAHYYHPMSFTHQGAPWSKHKNLSGVTWGTAEDRAKVVDDFQRAAAWSKEHHRPILLGEFGAYDKNNSDVALRAAYVAHVSRTAESMGWAWTYWQFDSDFILYDIDRNHWVEPILKALVP
ncbi:MAG: glycoside hydrolase family 5 protein [Verrucomicrobiota bacterium]